MQIRTLSTKNCSKPSHRQRPFCFQRGEREWQLQRCMSSTVACVLGWLLLVSAAIVVASKRSDTFLPSSTMEKTHVVGAPSQATVQFDEVPAEGKSRDQVLRYAARLQKTEGSSESSFSPITMGDWINFVTTNKHDCARKMTELLREAPFEAFRFETPGVSIETVHTSLFEFVLINDPHLGRFAAQEDPATFSEHLACDDSGIGRSGPAACAFGNLGGDSILVSPRNWQAPPTSNANYHGHVANFMRGASMEQILETWKVVALKLQEQLLGDSSQRSSTEPLWLSTAGDGVAWLHFRLDSRPKYYHYRPYRNFSST